MLSKNCFPNISKHPWKCFDLYKVLGFISFGRRVFFYVPNCLFYNEGALLFQLGAAAVNLVAGEKPADVYSGIAAR